MIPRQIVEFVKSKIKKQYEIDEKEIERIFFSYAIKDKKFMDRVVNGKIEGFERLSSFKEILKKTKKEIYYNLRQYKRNAEQRKVLFKKLKRILEKEGISENAIKIHEEILCTHISSKERIDTYPFFYDRIFEFTGKPKRILDIACGMNPFSLPFMKLNDFTYICTELKQEDCDFINSYFKIISKHINVEAKAIRLNLFDLTSEEFGKKFIEENDLMKFDVVFLLKDIPVMERLRKGISKYIIRWLPTNYIVISGSKKSMVKGKEIKKREERLIRRVLNELNLNIASKIEFENEIVFIVKKNNHSYR
ncbi:MAG: hypothetical protein OH319_04455 [Candidatus Parvarchaeota archaeon]|nr:hypothetical protein [Candidatus Jingweiarchaeum tengchongense]MCW1297911.1 hypothetical protein [Candidatus Jingweiarchaeum tengchongense]MCW1300656.1 hypothetical protein [Candidatus Jingweiarchaeum tengchongense]MCW1304650.1 hypothetical protein [Candidatus Jingweiarchaeum tengchongense]MCW1306043.1 hypothetical protein [Candidatus Jingweiarchaeum tengchongense]